MNLEKRLEYVSKLEDELSLMKHNKANLDHRIKGQEKKVDSIKKEIIEFMRTNGVVRTETQYFYWSLRNSPESVIIKDMHKLPLKYLNVVTKPNKAEIKKKLRAGDLIDGAILAMGGKSLVRTQK